MKSPQSEEELRKMTVVQLKEYAKKKKVSLTGKTLKKDIVDALVLALMQTSAKSENQLVTDIEKHDLIKTVKEGDHEVREVEFKITASGNKFLDEFLYKFFALIIGNSRNDQITDTLLSKLFMTYYSQVGTDLSKEGENGVKYYKTHNVLRVIDLKVFGKRLENIGFKSWNDSPVTFTEEGIVFIARVCEDLLIDFLTYTSNYSKYNGLIKKNFCSIGKAELLVVIKEVHELTKLQLYIESPKEKHVTCKELLEIQSRVNCKSNKYGIKYNVTN